MQDPEQRDAELDALRQGARLQGRAGQRLLAGRRPDKRDLLRPAAIPAVLARGRTARRAVLSASAQSDAGRISPLYDGHHWLLGPNWAFAAETARACAAADRQRPVRRIPAAADHSRPSRRGPAVLSLAHRQSQQLDEGAAQIRREEAGRGLFPRQFPPHHLGPLLHLGADRRRSPRSASSACCGRSTIRSRISATPPTGSIMPRSARPTAARSAAPTR